MEDIKKRIKDSINKLKSRRKEAAHVKLTKTIDHNRVMQYDIKIKELERLLKTLEEG